MMAIGRIIRGMDMECIIIPMAIGMKAPGVMMLGCRMENFILQLAPSTLANLLMMRSMAAPLAFLRINLRRSLNCSMPKMIKDKVFLVIFQMGGCRKNAKPISRMETSFKGCF